MQEFRRQHDWETAREAALVRDGYRCQRCEVLTVGKFQGDWESLPSAPTRPDLEAYANLDEFQEAMEAWRNAWGLFVARVVKPRMPEVNHKVPRVGEGYAWGCAHHAEDLETLCHGCHVKVTKMQRAERKMQHAKKVYEEEVRNGRRGRDRPRAGHGADPGKNIGDIGVRQGEASMGGHAQGVLEGG